MIKHIQYSRQIHIGIFEIFALYVHAAASVYIVNSLVISRLDYGNLLLNSQGEHLWLENGGACGPETCPEHTSWFTLSLTFCILSMTDFEGLGWREVSSSKCMKNRFETHPICIYNLGTLPGIYGVLWDWLELEQLFVWLMVFLLFLGLDVEVLLLLHRL